PEPRRDRPDALGRPRAVRWLHGLLHGNQMYVEGVAAAHSRDGADRDVGRVLVAVRAGWFVDEPVRRAQYATAERRLLDDHGGADAELQRRLHPAVRACVCRSLDVAWP